MIHSFRDQGTEDLFDGTDSKAARKTLPQELWSKARTRLSQLDYATVLTDMRIPPSNRLEALKGTRKGQYSVRINDQYRICFQWDGGAHDVEVVDYH